MVSTSCISLADYGLYPYCFLRLIHGFLDDSGGWGRECIPMRSFPLSVTGNVPERPADQAGPAAKSEACLDAGQVRLPFESLHRKKPGGVQAQLHAGRSGLAS
jgi:hypothetical protein